MYDTQKLQEEAIKAIKENSCVFIEEIMDYLPCSKECFYQKKLHEVDAIRNELWINKVRLKRKLRKKWEDSENFTAEKHLYLLVGTDEERDILNSKPVQNININLDESLLSDDELDKKLAELDESE